jgi:hypothetical protein
MDSACFSPFSLRPGPLFPLKKLLKKLTGRSAEIRYENRVQFLWRTAENIEESGRTRLCKSLWNTCRNLADKQGKSGGKTALWPGRARPCNFL